MFETAARTELSKQRMNCVNTLHFSAIKLGIELHVRLWLAMTHLPRAVEVNFLEWMSGLKSSAGIMEVLRQLVLGADVDVLRKVFILVESPGFAHLLGFRTGLRTQALRAEDATVAACVLQLSTTFVGEASLTSLFFQTPPQCFVALLSQDPEAFGAQLGRLRCMWESLEALEKQAMNSIESKHFVDYMGWSLQQWCRGIFVMLAEAGWVRLPETARSEIQAYAAAHWQQLLAENLGDATRQASKSSKSGAFSAASVWHVQALGSQTCSDHGMPIVQTTNSRFIAPPSCQRTCSLSWTSLPPWTRAYQCTGRGEGELAEQHP